MASRLLDFQLDERDVARVRKRFAAASGKSLYVRIQRAGLVAGDLVKRRMQAASPRRTGNLRRSIKVRSRGLEVYIGPTAPHRHLVIRGHWIVTPGGRPLGRRARANPFVDRVSQGFERKAAELVLREWRSLLR